MSGEQDETDIVDLLGIGFGPSNLALAIALRESVEVQECGIRFAFVESQAQFGWHSSLLLPDAQLQVSPLKDLATMRDPTSSFTFINYLHQKGRLSAYINRGISIPSRHEWTAYLNWAAKRMEDVVTYNQSVVSVEADSIVNGCVQLLKVSVRNDATGKINVRFARNIVVGVGGVPNIPKPFESFSFDRDEQAVSPVVHSSSFLPQLRALEADLHQCQRIEANPASTSTVEKRAPLSIAVIGSGQSSAEMSLHLRQTLPQADVKLIHRSSALAPSDDSSFVNAAAFDPDRTDAYWTGSLEDRKAWAEEYRRTNYSVVRANVLEEIDKILYNQKVSLEFEGEMRKSFMPLGQYQLMPNTRVLTAERGDRNRVHLRLGRTKHGVYKEAEVEEVFDAVFLGTGFQRQPRSMPFLAPLSPYFPILDTDSNGRKAELGFAGEEESNEVIEALSKSSDSGALERLRHRVRGITREYRLVSYTSEAFTLPREGDPSLEGRESGMNSPEMVGSATRSPSRSSHDSESTLASHHGRMVDEDTFQPSIYFVGGNEETHGLADSLFSIVAHRAGELTKSIVKMHNKQTLAREAISTILEGQTNTILKGATRVLCEKCPLNDGEECEAINTAQTV